VLTEAIQTTMRRYRIENAYEQLKVFSRGKSITRHQLHQLIDQLSIPNSAKKRLKTLTPAHYTGLATMLAKKKI